LLFSDALKSVTFIGMKKTDELKSLLDEYCVPGFKTLTRVRLDEKDPAAFALTLVRRQKKQYAADAGSSTAASIVDNSGERGISIAASVPFTSTLSYDEFVVNGAA
jgi:hypothetical protein